VNLMRNLRISMVCVSFMLIMFGLVMVYSSSAMYAYETFGDSFYFVKRQIIAAIIGLILTVLVMGFDLNKVNRYSKIILFVSVIPLILVLIPGIGRSVSGAKRWIDLGILHFQPSEIVKITVLIYIAGFVSRKNSLMGDLFYGYIPPLAVIGSVLLLIVLEPDFGTALTIGFIGILLLFIAGSKIIHMAFTVLLSFPFLYYLVMSAPYRRRRILVFLNPWADQKGAGFQIVQSFLALGSGGLLGVGLGQSRQKLFFLPASHTDFIFSIIGEELGFVGAIFLISLFAILVWQGIRIAIKIDDCFRKYLVFGIIFTIGFEVIVNLGVVSGLLPTKGLPLPFISYGRTSLIMHMVAIGFVLNAARDNGEGIK